MLVEEKIFKVQKSACISDRYLMMYVKMRLSEREKKKVEDHLLSCEHCIDALQNALRKNDDTDEITTYADLAHSGNGDQPAKQKNKRGIYIALFAFCLLASSAAALYKFLKPNEKTDDNFLATAQYNGPDKKEPAISKVSVKPIFTEDNSQPVKESITESLSGNSSDTKEADPGLSAGNLEKNDNANGKIKEEVKKENNEIKKTEAAGLFPEQISETANPISKVTVKPVTSYLNEYKISSGMQNSLPGKTSVMNYQKELEFIFRQIDKKAYHEALDEILIFFSDFPDDVNGKYYRGYLYYQLQDNEKALADFEWILRKQDKTFYEDARWHKALIFNRTQKFDEARKIFNQIIAEKSTYSQRAKQLVELIGER